MGLLGKCLRFKPGNGIFDKNRWDHCDWNLLFDIFIPLDVNNNKCSFGISHYFLSILVYVQITNFFTNKTTAERFGYKAIQAKDTQNLDEIQERFEKHMVCYIFSIRKIKAFLKESAETVPSLLNSNGLLLEKRKRKGFGGGKYFRNCMAMCYRNKKEAFPDVL